MMFSHCYLRILMYTIEDDTEYHEVERFQVTTASFQNNQKQYIGWFQGITEPASFHGQHTRISKLVRKCQLVLFTT